MNRPLRRVLFLTYYFPPSGGPGVQRALKFARYLPAFGWQPTLLTVRPEQAAYPNLDPSMEAEVPASLRVVRTDAWDPYALYAQLLGKAKGDTVSVGFLGESEMSWKQRLARWVRANVFLPDARVGWVPYAVAAARRVLAEVPHDAVLTTGPPHSTHLAGRWLARRHGLPWLADFRDPWTGIDFYDQLPMSPPARRLDAALERAVLRDADAVTVVTPTMERGLQRRHARPYDVIENGFDPADFVDAPPPVDAGRFVLAYVGNLNEARNPEALWRALRALDAPRTMPELEVRLVGNVDPAVLASAERHGVASCLATRAYVPHAEAVRTMRGAGLLLLVINDVPGAEGITTGKLYEYVASGRSVLGLGPVPGDAAAILEASGAGRMIAYRDADAVAALLRRHVAAWRAGRAEAGAPPERAAVYSRRRQTGQLAAVLDRILS